MSGTTQYFIRLEDGEDYDYFQLSAADVPLAVLLNVGDQVEITYYPAAGGVAQPASDVRLLEADRTRAAPPTQVIPYDEVIPDQPEEPEFLESEN